MVWCCCVYCVWCECILCWIAVRCCLVVYRFLTPSSVMEAVRRSSRWGGEGFSSGVGQVREANGAVVASFSSRSVVVLLTCCACESWSWGVMVLPSSLRCYFLLCDGWLVWSVCCGCVVLCCPLSLGGLTRSPVVRSFAILARLIHFYGIYGVASLPGVSLDNR